MFFVAAILLVALYIFLGLKRPGIAVITSPIVCFILVFSAFLLEEEAVIAIAVFLAFVLFVATLTAVSLSKPKRWPHVCAKWFLIVLATIMLLLLSAMACAVFGPACIFLFFLFIIFVASVIAYGFTARRSTAAYVITTIGSSMRQNLPLPMALESAAGGRDDKRSSILRRIQRWLVQGYSLSESIKRGYPACPGHAVAMIAAAERINQLPFAMKSIEADIASKTDLSRAIRPVNPWYPAILVIAASFIVWGILTFVMPQFTLVLEEMTEGARLPAATRVLIRIVDVVAYQSPIFMGVLVLVIFVVFPVWLYTAFRPRRPQKPHLLSLIGDFVKWHLPVLHWFENDYSRVQTVEMLRLSLNAGCTVNDAIANTLGLDVNFSFRKRLYKWLQEVERGGNIAAAARKSKLGSSLAWAFDDKINQGNTLAILETLESFYRANYNYRANITRYIMGPCVTLIMASMVGFVVYAIYSAPVAIIRETANMVYP